MVTYQDLRNWIATNKGEEAALLLDKTTYEFIKQEADTCLSEMLSESFIFRLSPEGERLWRKICDELAELEELESKLE